MYYENGNIAYELESKPISIGDKTTIYDNNHNEVAYIKQELLHMLPTYKVYIKGKYEYTIKKKLKLLEKNYILSNLYTVNGDLLRLDFSINNPSGKKIAIINRKFISIGDKYQVDILDENDITLILTIVVAITNDIDREQSSE